VTWIKYPDTDMTIISLLVQPQDNLWTVHNFSALPARFSLRNGDSKGLICSKVPIKVGHMMTTQIPGDTSLLVDIDSWAQES
jgi:hypothetical protein